MNPSFMPSNNVQLSADKKGEGIFSSIDIIFGHFLERISGGNNPYLFAAAALASRSVREGNVCFDLHDAPAMDLPPTGGMNVSGNRSPEDWQKALLKSSVVGEPGEVKPLILDQALRLYLFRYWEYEQELSTFLTDSGRQTDGERLRAETETCGKQVARLFPDPLSDVAVAGSPKSEINWQKVAACSVLMNKLTVVSGGPGTGKTLTIARAIILLLEVSKGKMPRVALAAPTGKAAARLQGAVLQAAEAFVKDEAVLEAMPKQATTIHRLIGGIPHSSGFRWNRENPLPFDTVVVDEASMVDLPLLVKLIRALPEHARLILLGDRDQLASIEAGAVLGDICGYRELNDFSAEFAAALSRLLGEEIPNGSLPQLPPSPLRNSLIELRRNYRFSEESKISRLGLAIKEGDGRAALSILQDKGDDSCRWLSLPSVKEMPLMIKEAAIHLKNYFAALEKQKEYEDLFDLFDSFRILCALRRGPYGSIEVNRLCEQELYRTGLISGHEGFYPGQPVMITTNDYRMRLFNGDTGFILPDGERGGGLSAFFRGPGGEMRRFSPLRLPARETVYATTVHKSQGSEFDHVLLILPNYDAPVLTRELIYTAVTRARKTVTIRGNEDIFVAAVSRRLKRSSGLRDALGIVS